MKLTLAILLLSLLRCKAPVSFAGTVRLSGVAQFNQATAAASNDPVFNNAKHVYHLGEASGNARVDTIGAINLSEVGGAVSSAAGKHGNAADFNTVGRWLAADNGHNFGNESPPCQWMAMWIYIRTLPALNTVSYIMAGINLNTYLYVDHSGNVGFNDASSDDTDVTQALGALNTWHLIVVGTSIAGGTAALSVDNATLTTTSSILGGTPDDSLRLGPVAAGSPPVPPAGLLVPDGLIDEVVIGTDDLTQSIVTSLWSSGNGVFYSP